MDRAEIEQMLESCRPQDASDPIFAEALRVAASDPELAARFAEGQRFDAVMIDKLRAVPVPAHLREQILQGFPTAVPPPARWPRAWWGTGSIAALLLLGLFSWQIFAPHPARSQLLAQQAIAFTNQMPALQFVCFDAAAVAQWVNEQPDAQKVGVRMPAQEAAMSMAMIGSSMVHWNGRPVVMVCLQHGPRMAMLYIMKAEDAGYLPDGSSETVQKADWVVRTTKAKGQVRVLAAKGRPEDLNFPMPL